MKRILAIILMALIFVAVCACTSVPSPELSGTGGETLPANTAAPTQPPAAPQPSGTGKEPQPANTAAPTQPNAAAEWQVRRFAPGETPMLAAFHWAQIVTDTPFQLGSIAPADADTARQWIRYMGAYPSWVTDLGTYPSIDGSTVALKMAMEFAGQHLHLADTSSFVSFHRTHQAYENLILNENKQDAYDSPSVIGITDTATQTTPAWALVKPAGTDLFIGVAPSEAELKFAADNGVELIMKPVCWDAFVFVTYKDNPVDSLTIAELRGIYTGRITNWAQVGGDNLPIHAYSRNQNSGSQTAMEELVMQGQPMSEAIQSEESVGEMSSLLEAVAYTDGSLGYTYKYYLFQSFSEGKQYSPAEELKTLGINGIAPSSQNIVNASYPFSVNYYGVIRKGDEQKTGGLFLEWMLSLEGQACIRQAGYIPMDGRYTAYYFDSDGFVFPDSSKRLLNEADMERLYENSYYDRSMLEMLGFARNEIFARHGHGFQNAKYTEHYAQFGWYTALPRKTVQLSELNAAEQANVRFIKQWEETTRARMSENARGLEEYRVR